MLMQERAYTCSAIGRGSKEKRQLSGTPHYHSGPPL